MYKKVNFTNSTESQTCEGRDEWLFAQGSAPREQESEIEEATIACPKRNRRVKPWSFTLLILFFVAGCATSSGSPKYQKKGTGNEFLKINSSNQSIHITPEEVKEKIDSQEEFNLVDIRPYPLYSQAHIVGAISMPFEEIISRYEELNPRDEIVLYCRIGQTTLAACELLNRLGFNDVKSMQGGILQWRYGLVTNGFSQLI